MNPSVPMSVDDSDLSITGIYPRLLAAVRGGHRLFLLCRGLPGRGKSYFAEQTQAYCERMAITATRIAADDFMLNEEGDYEFDIDKLPFCHYQCSRQLCKAMQAGIQVVISHNTSSMVWESSAIRSNAEELGYITVIVEPPYAWSLTDELPEHLRLVLTNVHGATEAILLEMKKRKQALVPYYVGHFVPRCAIEDALQSHSPACRDTYGLFLEQHVRGYDSNRHLLHVTTDYLRHLDPGSFPVDIFTGRLLEPSALWISALYCDHRGIGALVIDGSDLGNIPEAGSASAVLGTVKYFKAHSTASEETAGDDIPHMTLRIGEGFIGKDLGDSAKEVAAWLACCSNMAAVPRDTIVEAFGSGQQHQRVIQLVLLSSPIALSSVFAGVYSPKPNKASMFQWLHASDEEERIFNALASRRDVHVTEEIVPEAIIRGGWSLADVKVSPPKGRSDDEAYLDSELLRCHLPRGLCYLVSPERVVEKVLTGLAKFGSLEKGEVANEDDIKAIDGDVNVDIANSNVDTEEGNGNGTIWPSSVYFTKAFDTANANRIRVLVTEKANGEAAHITMRRIDGEVYIIGGSKNVHMLTRLHSPGDVDLYQGDRYGYAKDIMHCFYGTVARMNPRHVEQFVTLLLERKWTAVFEYEDPTHAHVIPLTPPNSKPSIRAICPEQALRIMSELMFDTVWHFTSTLANHRELQDAILVENDLLFEGCVLYFIDEGQVIGLLKCKNAFYICSRAMRERVLGFLSSCVELVDTMLGANSLNRHLTNVLGCQDPVKRSEVFDSCFSSVLANVNKRMVTERYKACVKIKERFDALSAEQVSLSVACSSRWVDIGSRIVANYESQLVSALQRAFVDEKFATIKASVLEISSAATAVPTSDITATADSETDVQPKAKKQKVAVEVDAQILGTIVEQIKSLWKDQLGSHLDPTTARNSWPTTWMAFIDNLVGSRQSLGIEIKSRND